jgi:TonB family protein
MLFRLYIFYQWKGVNDMSHTAMMAYGAFEIKRCYQVNMLTGLAVAIIISFVVLILSRIFYPEQIVTIRVECGKRHATVDTFNFQPPPIIVPGIPKIRSRGSKMDNSVIGIPVPVPDDMPESESAMLNTIDDLKRFDGTTGDGDLGSSGDGPSDRSGYQLPSRTEYLPPPDTFIVVELLPEPINDVIPEYPRLARESGLTAYLKVQAFIDKTGTVRKVLVLTCSRPGLGFEESAMSAGYKVKYRPAIQNGNPVGVWIYYELYFRLADK